MRNKTIHSWLVAQKAHYTMVLCNEKQISGGRRAGFGYGEVASWSA